MVLLWFHLRVICIAVVSQTIQVEVGLEVGIGEPGCQTCSISLHVWQDQVDTYAGNRGAEGFGTLTVGSVIVAEQSRTGGKIPPLISFTLPVVPQLSHSRPGIVGYVPPGRPRPSTGAGEDRNALESGYEQKESVGRGQMI